MGDQPDDDRCPITSTPLNISGANFKDLTAMLVLPGGRVLVADGPCIRAISADLTSVTTVAGSPDEQGFVDGASLQARFYKCIDNFLLLADGCVLVSDTLNRRIRLLSADLQQVSTVAGNGERGSGDGAAVEAQFRSINGLALLPDGCVLVTDSCSGRIRMLSADLQQVSTVAGNNCWWGLSGDRDGESVQALFCGPSDLAVLADGSILVADRGSHKIRMLSADLELVSTVAGNGEDACSDGASMQAEIAEPQKLAVMRDGRVIVLTYRSVRILSADLKWVSTVVQPVDKVSPTCLAQLPDGSVLVGNYTYRMEGIHEIAKPTITRLDGFSAWFRRRTLLMSLIRVNAAVPPAGVADDSPVGAMDDVLLRMAALPEVLWKGPLIFQYL